MKTSIHTKFLFLLIFFLASYFRLTHINWDQNSHLHPDERAIIMFSLPLHLPPTFSQFLLPTSPWNPHFFAYGSFPLYLLHGLGLLFGHFNPLLNQYDGINLLGRIVSGLFDLGTLLIIFLLGRKLKDNRTGLIASFFYAVSVLPIQLSHFYAVDTILTFFLTVTLYQLIRLYEKPTITKSVIIGVLIGFALATKISATVIIVSVIVTVVADFVLMLLKHHIHIHQWIGHVPRFLLTLIKDLGIIAVMAGITFAVLEPYALIDFTSFLNQNLQQAAMTKDAFTFPYTLQYVDKPPYLYELKNVFLWGLGPLLSLFCFPGILYGTYLALSKHRKAEKWAQELIVLAFFWAYLFTVGKFAIGFMRYMLPVYPLFCLFGGILFTTLLSPNTWLFLNRSDLTKRFEQKTTLLHVTCYIILFLLLLIWPLSFMYIYSQPNTRMLASQYINAKIPAGKTIAIEHWDDGLPLFGQQNYHVETLALYEPDTPAKWQTIDQQLELSDYIIIASNRLYVPLHKLASCQKHPFPHCYPLTDQYYSNLFSNRPVLPNNTSSASEGNEERMINPRFQKIAEFAIYPTIPFFNIPIDDQSADESFTVYDHPKVMIFAKSH